MTALQQQQLFRRVFQTSLASQVQARPQSPDIHSTLKAVRSEYQKQVDHVIEKWKELLDRSQRDVEQYRSLYHSERTLAKKYKQSMEQYKAKLKKYKRKDDENQVIIKNLQQQLNELYDDLTEITTPTQTPKSKYSGVLTPIGKRLTALDAFYNRHQRSPLCKSLPPPVQFSLEFAKHAHMQEIVKAPMDSNMGAAEDDDTDIALGSLDLTHKIEKTRADLKKILDAIDDTHDNSEAASKSGSASQLHVARVSSKDEQLNVGSSEHGSGSGSTKYLSVVVKYKDALFHHKNNTIKITSMICLREFMHQLCSESINIDPQWIILQHHNQVIDTSEEGKNMQRTLSELGIDNFDHVFVYLNYEKLLSRSIGDDVDVRVNVNGDDDDEKQISMHLANQDSLLNVCEDADDDDDGDDAHDDVPSSTVALDALQLMKKCRNLFQNLHRRKTWHAQPLWLLQKNTNLLYSYCTHLEHEQCLYAMLMNGICEGENDASVLCRKLCAKLQQIMQCQFVRLYFKRGSIVQLVYPFDGDDERIKQRTIKAENKSLLMDLVHEVEQHVHDGDDVCCSNHKMRSYKNPSENDAANFNTEFNAQFEYDIDSCLLAPLLCRSSGAGGDGGQQQLVGVVQMINRQNAEEFTLRDQQLLAPLTKVLAVALKLLYHLSPTHAMFADVYSRDEVNRFIRSEFTTTQPHHRPLPVHGLFANIPHRVHRGVSRAVTEHQSKQSISLSVDDQHHLLQQMQDGRHNSISHHASPIMYGYDNVSAISSQTHETPNMNGGNGTCTIVTSPNPRFLSLAHAHPSQHIHLQISARKNNMELQVGSRESRSMSNASSSQPAATSASNTAGNIAKDNQLLSPPK